MGPKFSYGYQAADMVKAAMVLRSETFPARHRWLLYFAASILPSSILVVSGFAAASFLGDARAFLIVFFGVLSAWLIGGQLSDRIHKWAWPEASSAKALENAPVQFEFSEDSLRVAMPETESVYRWGAIHHAFENDGAIYLVIGMSGVLISSRAFTTPQERQSAVDWILAHLSPDARARSRLRSVSSAN